MDVNSNPGRSPGPVAIVTGGGRGLGRAMVLGLAGAGIRVVATAARERAEVEAVAEEARRICGEPRVLPVVADATRPDDCRAVVELATSRFGRLDILVNNAGRGMKYVSADFMAKPTRFWEVEPDIWRMLIDTNVNGPFLMARSAVPLMIKGGWGRIINISVSRETMRRRGFSPYGPSKAALESETIIWARDLAETGVTVNALLPGGAHPHRHGPGGLAGPGQIGVARSFYNRTAIALAGIAPIRRRDRPEADRNAVAGASRRPGCRQSCNRPTGLVIEEKATIAGHQMKLTGVRLFGKVAASRTGPWRSRAAGHTGEMRCM